MSFLRALQKASSYAIATFCCRPCFQRVVHWGYVSQTRRSDGADAPRIINQAPKAVADNPASHHAVIILFDAPPHHKLVVEMLGADGPTCLKYCG